MFLHDAVANETVLHVILFTVSFEKKKSFYLNIKHIFFAYILKTRCVWSHAISIFSVSYMGSLKKMSISRIYSRKVYMTVKEFMNRVHQHNFPPFLENKYSASSLCFSFYSS